MSKSAQGFSVTLNNKVLLDLIRDAPDEADKVIRKLAVEGVGYVKLSMGTSPAGASYGAHIASAPGYPPNVDTGALRAGIGNESRGQHKAAITSSQEYGPHLEFGTSRMGARPFMRPMAEWLNKQIDDHFQDFI